jgi:hypothetical protein
MFAFEVHISRMIFLLNFKPRHKATRRNLVFRLTLVSWGKCDIRSTTGSETACLNIFYLYHTNNLNPNSIDLYLVLAREIQDARVL